MRWAFALLTVTTVTVLLSIPYAAPARASSSALTGVSSTVYLPNITKMLGGADGWQTPFIVQNVGDAAAQVEMDFYAFADGSLVKVRSIPSLAPGTSVFHDPNSDPDLAAGGQYSVVVQSAGSRIVAVVNEHQNVTNQSRQEALSYGGLGSGATKVYLPYVAKSAGGWLTTIIIQNLGAAPTTVTATFTSLAGNAPATLTRTIAPGRAQFIDPRGESALAAGAEYSVVLSADQPIGAVVNAHNDAADVANPRGFSYDGIAASSDFETWVPYLARNTDGIGRTSRVFIQNTGTTPVTPGLFFRRFGDPTPIHVSAQSIAPGAAIALDIAQTAGLTDGEYGLHIQGGPLVAVAAVTSQATALGYPTTPGNPTKIWLPNVTRTLGGANGWTTPIILQGRALGATSATLSWYRFSDGSLVYKQLVLGLAYGTSWRVDPRNVPQVADNTQYAVVVEAPAGGVSAVVTELNFTGGDGAMAYQGFARPPLVYGTTGCTPSGGPAGTTFTCNYYGFPPGTTPFTLSLLPPSGPAITFTSNDVAASDGSVNFDVAIPFEGVWTIKLTGGTVSQANSLTVLPATFQIQMSTSQNGQVSAITTPGLACTAIAIDPSGTFTLSPGLDTTQVANASGQVTWTYTKFTTPGGTWRHQVSCTQASQTLIQRANFTVP